MYEVVISRKSVSSFKRRREAFTGFTEIYDVQNLTFWKGKVSKV